MSVGTRLPWAAAADLARAMCEELAPAVVRTKVVGSVRRRRPEVGDIEILAEPRMIPAPPRKRGRKADPAEDLFGETAAAPTPDEPEMVPDLEPAREVVGRWGEVVKGGERYIQVVRPDGIKVDLFLCHPPAQWGSLLAIRTGPSDLSREAVTRIKARGYVHDAGHAAFPDGTLIRTPTEWDFFALAGLALVPPAQRDTPAALAPGRPSFVACVARCGGLAPEQTAHSLPICSQCRSARAERCLFGPRRETIGAHGEEA